jgi:hypothetical protein
MQDYFNLRGYQNPKKQNRNSLEKTKPIKKEEHKIVFH